jgi:hypothetical protein
MNLDDAKRLQELCTRHEIVKKVLDNWRSDASMSLTIMCLGNMLDVKKDLGIPFAHPAIGDNELAQDIEAALEAQVQRLENQIASY